MASELYSAVRQQDKLLNVSGPERASAIDVSRRHLVDHTLMTICKYLLLLGQWLQQFVVEFDVKTEKLFSCYFL